MVIPGNGTEFVLGMARRLGQEFRNAFDVGSFDVSNWLEIAGLFGALMSCSLEDILEVLETGPTPSESGRFALSTAAWTSSSITLSSLSSSSSTKEAAALAARCTRSSSSSMDARLKGTFSGPVLDLRRPHTFLADDGGAVDRPTVASFADEGRLQDTSRLSEKLFSVALEVLLSIKSGESEGLFPSKPSRAWPHCLCSIPFVLVTSAALFPVFR